MPQKRFNSIDLPEQAAPANPAAGRRRLYFKTDGKLYQRNSAGTEVEVGGGTGAAGEDGGFGANLTTSGNITLSGHQTIDGVLTTNTTVVLVKNQTTASQNGVYVANSGAWTRHPTFDNVDKLAGAMVRVYQGSTGKNTIWKASVGTGAIGTANVDWWSVVDRLGLDLAYAPPSQSVAVAGTETAPRLWTAERVREVFEGRYYVSYPASDLPSAYPIGVSSSIGTVANGYPIDGLLVTHMASHSGGIGYQEISDKDGKFVLRRVQGATNNWLSWMVMSPQSGVAATGTMTVNVGKDISVTFAHAYSAAPTIVLTQMDLANPESTFVSANSVGTTGFTIRAKRTAGTASFNVAWQATPKSQ